MTAENAQGGQSGAITPEIWWHHYADNEMAPIRRKFTPSMTGAPLTFKPASRNALENSSRALSSGEATTEFP